MKPKPLFWLRAGWAVLLMMGLAACGGGKPGRGFYLPQGDPEKGRETFVQLGCTQCHQVSGVELPAPATPGPVQIKLGGEVLRVRSYGELVTSIIAPSHVVSHRHAESIRQSGVQMPDYTGTMTVRQLIDVVTFLHAQYRKVVPQYQEPLWPGPPGVFSESPPPPFR